MCGLSFPVSACRRGVVVASIAMGTVLTAFPAAAMAQLTVDDLPWSDDFDSYADGSTLSGQGVWEAWDDDPDAGHYIVSSAQAHAGAQSVRITGVDDAVVQFNLTAADGTGVFEISVWSWVPPDMSDNVFFIMLNTYAAGGSKNWSLDLELDGAAGEVIDSETGNTVDLVYGSWAKIEIVVDLISDWCEISYDGEQLGGRLWSQGGELRIGAIDLWADQTSHEVYFDDLVIRGLNWEGACCFADATCVSGQSPTDCEVTGGIFQGFQVVCPDVLCPLDGPNGWQVTAPFVWSGNTCEESDACVLREGEDEQWEVTIPSQGEWTFSVCGGVWDTWLALAGDTGCSVTLASNDDACDAGSEITLSLPPGVYFLTLEGFSPTDCGAFVIVVTRPPCPADLDASNDVGLDDLADVLTAWGSFGGPADIDHDGHVDFGDLLLVLSGWGPCP